MSGIKELYVVGRVVQEVDLDFGGFKKSIDLKWIEGQSGCLPVFDNREDAHREAKKRDDGVFVINVVEGGDDE